MLLSCKLFKESTINLKEEVEVWSEIALETLMEFAKHDLTFLRAVSTKVGTLFHTRFEKLEVSNILSSESSNERSEVAEEIRQLEIFGGLKQGLSWSSLKSSTV